MPHPCTPQLLLSLLVKVCLLAAKLHLTIGPGCNNTAHVNHSQCRKLASKSEHMACAAFKMLAARLQQTVLHVGCQLLSEVSLHTMTAAKKRFFALQEALLS